MECVIRRVRPGDENDLARIQTQSWKAAFAAILDGETLERCTDLSRAADMYRALLEDGHGNGYLLLTDGRAHGIAWWDAARDAEMAGKAELICIHSLPDQWHMGFGTRLMERVLADIAAQGYAEVMLWVFAENHRARAFYEKLGFRATEHTKDFHGATEACYLKKLGAVKPEEEKHNEDTGIERKPQREK